MTKTTVHAAHCTRRMPIWRESINCRTNNRHLYALAIKGNIRWNFCVNLRFCRDSITCAHFGGVWTELHIQWLHRRFKIYNIYRCFGSYLSWFSELWPFFAFLSLVRYLIHILLAHCRCRHRTTANVQCVCVCAVPCSWSYNCLEWLKYMNKQRRACIHSPHNCLSTCRTNGWTPLFDFKQTDMKMRDIPVVRWTLSHSHSHSAAQAHNIFFLYFPCFFFIRCG